MSEGAPRAGGGAGGRGERARNKDLPVFVAVAYGLAWLVAIPIWVSGRGAAPSWGPLLATGMMLTPTVAVLAVWLMRRTPAGRWARETGLTLGPRRGRTIAWTAAAWAGIPALGFAAIAVSAWLGLLDLDLSALTRVPAGAGAEVPPQALVAAQVFGLLIAPAINAIPSLGEEWGWRGWLLPRLMPYGTAAALVGSGVIWGLWHAPLELLGRNYPALGAWGALFFTGFCVIFGAVLGRLRMITGSVWPAVVAHGAFNASAPYVLVVAAPGEPPNTALAGPFGLVGWVLMALVAVALLRVRGPREPLSSPSPTAPPARHR
ncbi:CPBP family intramembrane glutamic endopeptidase [Bailinhaonella thermotolerans]|uniref:CPBP family intramembrane metalloprotease n=1 Tax=Bailinhaonella thermotolerans TaxID=1070861 RepID=A0A3A4AP51_9ACTN|nr:CPBP family intramembrane glutamic endopeptidase [Bailinhaonella thermotolerans]RJL31446.1 CPBP family intramembrane metalloprotease [Bailinhaonella thermotolerans]